MTDSDKAFRWKLIWAFATVYFIWGSTYIGIRFALETMPAYTLAAVRFLTAGAIMYVWARSKNQPVPTAAQWRSGALVGTLLLAGGNGLLVIAQKSVPSGLAALIITTVPLWMVLLDWARPGGVRPRLPVVLGLIGGLIGVGYLIDPSSSQTGTVPAFGAILLLVASLSWAVGSLVARGANLHPSPLMNTATQMLGGGVVLAVGSVLMGEHHEINLAGVSLKSALALLYLILFGAIMGYTAYIWLLKNVDTAKAATYAYVNPVVAVFLGWSLAGEELTSRSILAAAIIVGSVGLITSTRAPARRAPIRAQRVGHKKGAGDASDTSPAPKD